ncbi:TetR/AcrR family transcriptional regulator [Robiginitalea aurantiaca]|uniref:TetR/AcrR family transcriptional regulator n=1 Tax=Robiginitalea aurantiaca TaxID=3056915 RepID=A0ABT7WDJ3_9FLAO|nr:TetR/AcrR family transcriptional regulator [Robiginitalea aurantiaca]MDM9630990.1 TetR/AcrR family transcriptional regulator [Robiginitalea aurantiaca]
MSEVESKRHLWIEKGYEHFALYGPENLSINKISKDVGSSRASFYHHFGDVEIFIDELLTRHWHIIEAFNKLGKEEFKVLIPDLYDALGEYTIPLQFNLQLFHHRSTPGFNYLFIKSYESSARSFALELFAKHLGLTQSDSDVYHLWLTLGEAWYSRLDPDDLTSGTLQKFAKEIIQNLSVFTNSPLYTRLRKTV